MLHCLCEPPLSDALNPYLPPRVGDSQPSGLLVAERLRIPFDGTPTVDCYRHLVLTSRADRFIVLVLVLLSPIFILFLLGAGAALVAKANLLSLFSFLGMLTVGGASLWAIYFYLWPRRSALRQLEGNRDLLNFMAGYIASDGTSVCSHNGRVWWLSPLALCQARVNGTGIAIPISRNPDRFLPISNLLIGPIDREMLNRVVGAIGFWLLESFLRFNGRDLRVNRLRSVRPAGFASVEA